MRVAASHQGITLWSMVDHASLVVQLMMLILLVVSIVSWTMIFRKWFILKKAYKDAERFEDTFWRGANVNQMYAELSRNEDKLAGNASVFVAGFREYTRLEKQKGISPMDIVEGVQRAMRVALTRETDYLATNLSFLATVGSTSPYIGLFGTVWGIMSAFQSFGNMQQATLAHVAPGISEALVATAMGLFAAIPAVIAYNRYADDTDRLASRYEIFLEEFSSVLQRQAYIAKGST
nr:protein TolQ [Acidiferrobacter sp.]